MGLWSIKSYTKLYQIFIILLLISIYGTRDAFNCFQKKIIFITSLKQNLKGFTIMIIKYIGHKFHIK